MKKKLINQLLFTIFCVIIIYYINKNYIQDKNTLSIMIWYDIIDPNTIKQFEKEFGIKVNVKYYFSNEELISKLNINHNNIDIIFPSDYTIPILIKQKLIQPINPQKIKHFKDLLTKLLENVTYNKKCFAIPYAWSVFGIVVDENLYNMAKKINIDIDWYKLFFTGEYQNKTYKIGGTNDLLTIINLAYHYYKENFKKNKIYSKANLFNIIQEILKSQSKNTVVYLNTEYVQQLLENNMINITVMQSPDFLRIMHGHPTLPFHFFIPEYYNLLSCECFAIMRNTQNIDNCYLFINFLLQKEHIKDMVNKNFWFHTRKDLKIIGSPIFTEIKNDIEKKMNKSYYTEEFFDKKELLSLIMNLKS